MSDTPFEGWAIVELMGHRRLAGRVSEEQIAGSAFLRLDVPGLLSEPERGAATQFYSTAAVYCITPTTETIARQLAAKAHPQPVTRWELEPALDPALDLAARNSTLDHDADVPF